MKTTIDHLKIGSIKDEKSVKNFLQLLIKEEQIIFHPDNSFMDYINPDGKNTYTKKQAKHRESLFEKCLKVCEEETIYQMIFEINDSFNVIKAVSEQINVSSINKEMYEFVKTVHEQLTDKSKSLKGLALFEIGNLKASTEILTKIKL